MPWSTSFVGLGNRHLRARVDRASRSGNFWESRRDWEEDGRSEIPENRGTPERRQPGMTSANNRRSAGAVGRLGWKGPNKFSCWGAFFAPEPAHAANGWLNVSAGVKG